MGLYSITGKPTLVKKVYFPRQVLVVGGCLTALLMIFFEVIVFFAFMLFLGVIPTATIILFPLILFGEFLIIVGLSLALSALSVYYRDVQYIWAVVLKVLFFITPVIYPVNIYPPNYTELLMLNPMARVVEASRKTLIYGALPSIGDVAVICLSALIAIVVGYAIFVKLEPRFAEEV